MPQDDPHEQMTALCQSIPSIANCGGVKPWDAKTFAAAQGGRSHGEVTAASFVLTVWAGGEHHWPCVPRFCITDVPAAGDASLTAAVAKWIKNPFWP